MRQGRRYGTMVLLLAIVSGSLAAYATMRLMGERTSPLSAFWQVVAIAEHPRGYQLNLGEGFRFLVDTASAHSNARNIALLYEGKTVAISDDDRDCVMITPLLQQGSTPADAGSIPGAHLTRFYQYRSGRVVRAAGPYNPYDCRSVGL
jgi:hypothetical protein